MTYSQVKRVLDCGGALLALLVLSPVIAMISLLVLIFHGAPVIFVQERVTQHERIFRLRKFRSMRPLDPGRGWVTDEDRLTSFGRLLRSTSLDELPSLWNVVIGDMSMIGPRPLTTDYLRLYTPDQSRRHLVRGGLSGLSQVSGRNVLGWDEKFDLDVRYVETMCLALDVRILLKTFTTVLSRRGVSQDDAATTDSYGGSLRSDLVVFVPAVMSRQMRSWTVETVGGDLLGRCTTMRTGESSLMVRFHQLPSEEIASAPDYPELCREVMRLLLNRARSADADFAVCCVSSMSPSTAQLYLTAGFRPLTAELVPTVLPIAELITDQQIFLYQVLHAPDLTVSEMGVAS